MARKPTTPPASPQPEPDPFGFDEGASTQGGPAGASGETDPTVNDRPDTMPQEEQDRQAEEQRKETSPEEPEPSLEEIDAGARHTHNVAQDERPADPKDIPGSPVVSPVPVAGFSEFPDEQVNDPALGQVDPAGTEKTLFAPNPNPTAPINNPVPIGDPTVSKTDAVLRRAEEDARKIDESLGASVQPMPQSIMKAVRLGLNDLTVERQLELAIELNWTIGKASGYIPSFQDMTENMKGAYLKGVQDIWIAAQRAAREYNE